MNTKQLENLDEFVENKLQEIQKNFVIENGKLMFSEMVAPEGDWEVREATITDIQNICSSAIREFAIKNLK